MKVALLSALPHTREDLEIARVKPHGDYVRAVLKGHALTGGEIWSMARPVLEAQANRLFLTCVENEVEVVCNAGRAELAAAAANCVVVIVLAHWKGERVETVPSDVTGSPLQFDSALRRWAEARRRSIPEVRLGRLRDLPPRDARDQIAAWLNHDILNWAQWLFDDLGDGFNSAFATDSWGRHYARTLVDEHFGDAMLLPGARLELADGLWSPADVAACFPQDWSGVCDFVCCTSEYLADETKRRRRNATFRADSYGLKPAEVFAALRDLIPRLRRETQFGGDFVSLYISIAYDCYRKYKGNMS